MYSQMIFDKNAKNTLEKGQSFQQMMLGKLGIHIHKTEPRSLSLTTFKNELKVNSTLKCKTGNYLKTT